MTSNTNSKCYIYIVLLLVFGGIPSVIADHIKVDMDTRRDSTASGFQSWQPIHGTSQTFGSVTVSFSLVSPPAYTDWKIN